MMMFATLSSQYSKTRYLVVCLIAFIFILLIGINVYNESSIVNEHHIKKELEHIDSNDISPELIKSITISNWDKIYIFGPYTTRKQINQKLKGTWIFPPSLDHDQLELLVFTKNEKVVGFCELERNVVDLAEFSGMSFESTQSSFK